MSNSEDIISKNQNIPVTPEPVFVVNTKDEVAKIFRKNPLAEAMEPVYEMLAKFWISRGTDGMQFAKMIDARNQQITGEILRREAANDPNYHLKKDQIQKAA
jgi:hypothetical protein